MPDSIGTTGLYASFTVLVIALLAVDFFMLKKEGAHAVRTREAAGWSVVWVSIALAFGALFWWYLDGMTKPEFARARALEYFTGYLIEKSLAVDNVFVWITLFQFFAVPAVLQKRVLLYGVLGAIVMRAILIWLGAILLARFHWILYLFGLLLLATGVKMLLFAGHEPELAQNPVLRWMRGHLRITEHYHGERFFVVLQGVRHATPLFLVLVLIEVTDLIFAVDSIPAIFAVTRDPVHRVHLEHLRHPRTARDVFPAGRHGAALPPAEVWLGGHSHLHRLQDAAAGLLPDAGRGGAGRGGADPGAVGGGQPAEVEAGAADMIAGSAIRR
jgi:tellurite resistance protein TerC